MHFETQYPSGSKLSHFKRGRRCGKGRQSKRRGAATVEFALTVPLLFLFFFAGLEFSRAIVVRNNIQSAAMAGARRGILPGATNSQCEQAAQRMLDAALVKEATVIVSPTVIDASTLNITVSISVPLSANALPMSRFVVGDTLSQTITLRRENQAK